MEFKQELGKGGLKQVDSKDSLLRISEVASKCKLNSTDNGVKVECTYTGPNAGAYLQYLDKHKEEVTKYLLNPDDAPFYEWMEESHQTEISLKVRKEEKLTLYVNFDPRSYIMEVGISDDNVTVKLGAPLLRVDVNKTTRDEYKLAIYNMLLLAYQIAVTMENENLKEMASIESVKTYMTEIYDKYHEDFSAKN